MLGVEALSTTSALEVVLLLGTSLEVILSSGIMVVDLEASEVAIYGVLSFLSLLALLEVASLLASLSSFFNFFNGLPPLSVIAWANSLLGGSRI